MQDTEIYDWPATAAHRLKCRKVQKICVSASDWKNPAKDPEPQGRSCESPYQEAEGFSGKDLHTCPWSWKVSG